jgi:hypothetical protein
MQYKYKQYYEKQVMLRLGHVPEKGDKRKELGR